MNGNAHKLVPIDAVRRRAFWVGAVAMGLAILWAPFRPAQFFQSYLFAFVFWVGLALGSLALLMVFHLTGGRWGRAVRGLAEAAVRTLPLLAALFVPVLLGMKTLYVWADGDHVAHDSVLQAKQPFLNSGFFTVRALLYFAAWILLGFLVGRRSGGSAQPAGEARRHAVSGPGLVAYVLTMTLASVDWVMSLEPHWYSTMYGVIMIAGQFLGAFAFLIAARISLVGSSSVGDELSQHHRHDLGKLLFGFVMLWAYVCFSQFLIIWSGNLPEETPWVLHRTTGGWQWAALLVVLFHFAVPFCVLLPRSTKENARRLRRVAIVLLTMRVVDTFWIVAPAFHPHGFHVHVVDLLAWMGLGGLWFAMFLWQLEDRAEIAVSLVIAGNADGA